MTGTATATWAAGAAVRRLFPAGHETADLARHAQVHGPLPYRGAPLHLIGEIDAAGLTGRGGAAFPTGKKMAAVAACCAGPGGPLVPPANTAPRGRRGRTRPVAVGNGAEGEPASAKDKYLLWRSPHLVLDGLQLAAEAIGARHAYLYVHKGDGLHDRLRAAIAERSASGWDQAAVRLVAAPPRFIAGEESALASRIGGGLAMPTFTPPRTYERGVGGAPTLVQNVETLAHVALIARYGAAWFREAGTPSEPGTMLTTCHLADGAVAVAEAEFGTPLADLLNLDAAPVQAVLTGGYHGTWIRATDAAMLPLANSALRSIKGTAGAVGAGVLAALPHGRCGLAETARVAGYLAAESAGQCGPCLAGLPRIAGALAQLAMPYPDPRIVGQLERWAGLVEGRGGCKHPDGTVRFVRSALMVFADEITRHRQGRCAAGEAAGTGEPFLPVPAEVPLYRDDWR
jgi:NADH:ubiquinone oxidoreductase subunit F (NADH-binding)